MYSKLFRNKLEKLIVTKGLVFLPLLTAAVLLLPVGGRWLALAGLFAGTIIGIARFRCNEWVLKRVFGQKGTRLSSGGAAVAFTVNELMLLPAMALTYSLSAYALCGLVAGLLTIPAGILFNSITEALGITKNGFTLGGD